MAKIVHLYYEGPPSLIVELEREVNFGDVIECPEEVAPKLLQVIGIREATSAEVRKAKTAEEKASKEDDAAPPPAEEVEPS